jgi:AraC-like DNA-binding protein
MLVDCPLILRDVTLPPSGEWSPSAEGWHVVRVAEGAGYCFYNGQASELNAGDGFIAPENAKMLTRASQLGALTLQFFLVQPRLINGLLTIAESHQLSSAHSRSAYVVFFKMADPLGQKFARLAKQGRMDRLDNRCSLLHLWASGIAGLFELPVEEPGPRQLRDRFRQMVDQMPEAELSEHSLSDLAQRLQCSERHFSRLFREEFGVALRSRQIELRLQRALQLLTDPKIKISNIAHESGYRHIGLFNSLFKKRYGLTPSEWRRKQLAEEQSASRRESSPASAPTATPIVESSERVA